MDDGFQNWLTERIKQLRQELHALEKSAQWWIGGRLGAFMFLLIGWWVLGLAGVPVWASLIIGLILFGISVAKHRKATDRLDWVRADLRVTEEALRRASGQVVEILSGARPADRESSPFLTPGNTWRLGEHELDDLDLYARPVGLFGLLNRASTGVGAYRLREYLEANCLDAAPIQSRQAAVKWLANQHEARLAIASPLSRMRGLDIHLERFTDVVREVTPLQSYAAMLALRLWTFISVCSGAFAVWIGLNGNSLGWALLAVLLPINFSLLGIFWGRVRNTLQQWEGLIDVVEFYLDVARAAERHLPDETDLAEIRKPLSQVAGRDGLGGALPWLRWSTSGGFIQLILNAIAFYDVHMLDGIQRHVSPHQKAILKGFDAVGELEALLSLACFAAEEQKTSWPVIAEDATTLDISEGFHPLLPRSHAVANDVKLDAADNLWAITGSNMSGKSTYLRMIGVNIVLAQAGGVVCAKSMRWSPLRMMTDLRIRDNLGKGESYFLAEVRGLKRLVIPPAGVKPVFGLVDEPFRGTNHQEQHAATLAIVEHLRTIPGLFVVATHDRQVARTAESAGITCHHFAEDLKEGEMTFDYRLRKGIATTRNALRVLHREGYPSVLVDRAIKISESVTGER